jgi:hypothetical protein
VDRKALEVLKHERDVIRLYFINRILEWAGEVRAESGSPVKKQAQLPIVRGWHLCSAAADGEDSNGRAVLKSRARAGDI